MSSKNSALTFANALLPYFEGNPMYNACLPFVSGMIIIIDEPKEINEESNVCDHTLNVRFFTPATEESDNFEPVTFESLTTKKWVDEVKTIFLDLFGFSKVRRTLAFHGGSADPILLKDSRHFQDANYFGIENDDGQETITVEDTKLPVTSWERIVQYDVIAIRPHLKIVN